MIAEVARVHHSSVDENRLDAQHTSSEEAYNHNGNFDDADTSVFTDDDIDSGSFATHK